MKKGDFGERGDGMMDVWTHRICGRVSVTGCLFRSGGLKSLR